MITLGTIKVLLVAVAFENRVAASDTVKNKKSLAFTRGGPNDRPTNATRIRIRIRGGRLV